MPKMQQLKASIISSVEEKKIVCLAWTGPKFLYGENSVETRDEKFTSHNDAQDTRTLYMRLSGLNRFSRD